MRSIGIPEILVLFGCLFLLGFALMLLVAALRWKQSRSVQQRLIDKIPPNELSALLQTPHGEKLRGALADTGTTPERSILATVQRGVVVTISGIGILVATLAFAPHFDSTARLVEGIGTILIFLGLGLLIAAFVSYRLSKSLLGRRVD